MIEFDPVARPIGDPILSHFAPRVEFQLIIAVARYILRTGGKNLNHNFRRGGQFTTTLGRSPLLIAHPDHIGGHIVVVSKDQTRSNRRDAVATLYIPETELRAEVHTQYLMVQMRLRRTRRITIDDLPPLAILGKVREISRGPTERCGHATLPW